jgi:hypothetical protein
MGSIVTLFLHTIDSFDFSSKAVTLVYGMVYEKYWFKNHLAMALAGGGNQLHVFANKRLAHHINTVVQIRKTYASPFGAC